MKNMNDPREKCSFQDCFYGTATVGERGQIVIPAEARADLNINPGEKLLLMRHPANDGLMVFKIDAVREFLDEFSAALARVDAAHVKDDPLSFDEVD